MKTFAEIKTETQLPVVIADHRGTIKEINDSFTAVFGWRREELVGKKLETIIPKRLRDTHRLGFSRFLRTRRPVILGQPLDLKVLNKEGSELDGTHTIVAEEVDGNWMFAATVRPRGKF
jgi:PAS domain S-box-containing protein